MPPSSPTGARLIVDEARASGTTLTYANISAYIGALGGVMVLLQACVVYTMLEACRMGNVFWLSWWSQGRWDFPVSQWLGVYALWALGQSICALANLLFLADRGVKAARYMHDSMLTRILRAPVCPGSAPVRTALKDSLQGPPTANLQPLQSPTAANCHQPPTANRQPPPTSNCRQPPPTANL